jgi:hypothetical protein
MPLEQNVGETPLYFSGDALRLEITVQNGDAVGSPVLDLTPFTEITWALAKKQGAVPLVTKTLTGGPTQIDPIDLVNGRIDVLINNVDTAALKGTLYHELQLEPGPNTPMWGAFVIQADSITP